MLLLIFQMSLFLIYPMSDGGKSGPLSVYFPRLTMKDEMQMETEVQTAAGDDDEEGRDDQFYEADDV